MPHDAQKALNDMMKNKKERSFKTFGNNDSSVYSCYVSLTLEINFSGQSIFPGSLLSREVNFLGKSTFLGSQLFGEVNFLEKSTFPGSQLFREV